MATIHTAHGEGEVVEVEHGRMGKTRYKVAGYGFEMWLDATDPAIHTAGEDVFSYAPQVEMAQAAGRHFPGTPGEEPRFGGGHSGSDAWGMGHEGSNVDFGETDHSWDNSTTLPYRWEPKNPVEMYDHEQTISPDHDLGYSPEERTRSSDSVTGEDREDEHDYPGPAGHLFADKVAWTLRDEEDPNHLHEEERWEQYNHHALDVPHVAGYHGLDDYTDYITGHGPDDPRPLGEHYAEPPRGRHQEEPLDHPSDRAHFTANGPLIPEGHRAKPGEPSWQDHVNADAQRLQDQIGRDVSNPAHPDHVPPPREGSWQRPAGLSAKFADVHEAFNPNDPADLFRLDPDAAIRRHASFDRDAGLDPGTGQEQLLLPSDHQILRTAAWRDVREKAVRIVREGGVHVEAMDSNAIYANVDGDHGTYECMILTGAAYPNGGFSGGKQAIANWKCDCDWGKWAFKRQFTFVGRLCSHGYAAYLTQASHNAKHDPNHAFRKRRKKSSVEEFKAWVEDENSGHVDRDAADNYLAGTEDPVSREDAEKILDYVETHHSEHPERDYDVKGYHYDNDTGVLQHQPGKLVPHVYEAPERDEDKRHYFTDLGDDRKTTGPDQIQAKVAKGVTEHHPAFAWHDEGKDDFPDEGIVHFSALHLVADEDLLDRLRTMGEHGPAEHPHGAEAHNHEVSGVVDELHGRGYDAAPLVAMRNAALRRVADGAGDQVDPTSGQGLGGLSTVPSAQGGMADPGAGMAPPAPHTTPAESATVNPGWPQNPGGLSAHDQPPAPKGVGATSPAPAGAPGGVGHPAGGSGGVQPDGSWTKNPDTHDLGDSTYTVKPGDTLSDISQRGGLGDNYKSIADMNQIKDPDLIMPGQQLKMPNSLNPTQQRAPLGAPPAGFAGAGGAMGGGAGAPKEVGTAPAAPAGAGIDAKGLSALPGGGAKAPGGLKAMGARRFAELYFRAADDDGEDKNKSANPAAPATNQGENYKQVSQGNPLQPRNPAPAGGGSHDGNANGMGADVGDVHNANPLGAPAAGAVGVGGPKGTDTTTGPAPGQQQQQQGQHPDFGQGLQQALGIAENVGGALGGIPVIGPAIGGITNALSGLGGLGGALGHLGAADDAQRFAARYFEADGTFGGQGGGDWMDHSFAGSGPDRQNWSTTSEAYVDEHEGKNRDETWVTDLDGDVTAYTTKRPRQSARFTREELQRAGELRHANGDLAGSGDAGYGSTGGVPGGTLSTGGSGEGLGGSFAHAETSSGGPTMGTLTNVATRRSADGFHPSETGYYNPRNPTATDTPKGEGPGLPKRRAPGHGLPSANEAAGVGEPDEDDASSGAAKLLEGATAFDGSDVVRMFQANGGGCVSASATSGGHSDDSIAEQASRMLRTAGRVYSPAEQRELEDEFHPRGARNLTDLDLRGTHYEE